MKEFELIDKRKLREKQFLQKNGDIKVKIYDDDIHYLKNGKYNEIDNSIFNNDNILIIDNRAVKVQFDDSCLYKLIIDNRMIKVKIKGITKYTPVIQKNSKEISSVLIKNVFKDIDFIYNITNNEIKENILIKEKTKDISNICFEIETDYLLSLYNNRVNIISKDQTIISFDLPYVIDSNQQKSYDLKYELTNDENYFLKLIVNNKWIYSRERVYPIIIDPTIRNNTNLQNVYDSYINSNQVNTNYGSSDILKAGVERTNGSDIINRALLKFDLPTIGTGNQVIDAKLTLVGYITNPLTFSSDVMVIHNITESWDENTVTWNNIYDKYDSRIESCFESQRTWSSYNNSIIYAENTADITSLVQRWYTDLPNNGIMIMPNKELYKSNIIQAYYSKNNSVSGDPKPILEITYRNQNGIVSYMEYFNKDFNIGTSKVNSFNGNLVLDFNLASTNSNLLPVDLDLIYNTNDVIDGKNFGYGVGFKSNYNQIIQEKSIDGLTYLEYLDEDGTLHYFTNSKTILNDNNEVEVVSEAGTYYDEDGMNMEISIINNKYCLKDQNNSKMFFDINDGVGRLSRIVDSSNNEINILYNNNRIIKITDQDLNEINIEYLENVINVNYMNNQTILNYSNGKLTKITTKYNTLDLYYNSLNLIYKLEDENNYKIEYEYYINNPFKVKKVFDIGRCDSVESYETYLYGNKSTSILLNNNRKTTLTFNNNGSVKSMVNMPIDEKISESYGYSQVYGDAFQFNNKNTFNSNRIKYVNNLLINTSFEGNNNIFINSNANMEVSDEYANSGSKSLKIYGLNGIGEVYTLKNVRKGEFYNFSCFIKTNNSIKIILSYYEDNNLITSEINTGVNSNFEREDLSIYYSDNATTNLKIKIIVDVNDICYIDDIQLEYGELASNYNYIENSNFENGLIGWDLENNNTPGSDINYEIINLDSKTNALRITMDPEYSSSIMKEFNIKGNRGDKYTISFWYLNEGIDFYDENGLGDSSNNVVILYYPENTEEGHDVFGSEALNPNSENWQYFSETFVAEEDFVSIKLVIYQSLNANKLYITNLGLYKNIFYENYNYDTDGKLESTSNIFNKKTNYIYNKNNQLIKAVDDNNKQIVYEYDDIYKDRIIKNFNNASITNESIYDEYGNKIINRIINREQNKEVVSSQYSIRIKGTSNIIKLFKKSKIKISNEKSIIDLWSLNCINQEECIFTISHSIIHNRYLSNCNNIVCLTANELDNRFKLIRNDDNSYQIKHVNTGKYLKYLDDSLLFDNYDENSGCYDFYFEKKGKKNIEKKYMYNNNLNKISLETDSNLHSIKYNYNLNTKLLDNKIYPNNSICYYSYNSKGQNTNLRLFEKEVNYGYDGDNISSVEVDNEIYNFIYDEFGNNIGMKINNNMLVQNTFINGLLSEVESNNQHIYFEYDELDRIKKIRKIDDVFEYLYDENGNVGGIKSNNEFKKYYYDISSRLISYKNGNERINYKYDSSNNLINKEINFNDIHKNINVNYDINDDVISEEIDNDVLTIEYDNLNRIRSKSLNNLISTNYDYLRNGNRETVLVSLYTINDDSFKYKYDKMKNITHIYLNDKLINKYSYDKYNRLLSSYDYNHNIKTTYKYDINNNIISRLFYNITDLSLIRKDSFEYNNINWKDQLTKYNGNSIIYDSIGNITKINNDILEWTNIKQLKKYNDIEYKYNYLGERIEKKKNNIITKYFIENNNIIGETDGNNTIFYIRESNGNLIGLEYNNNRYYYIKNIQNDIIALVDDIGQLIGKYEYDEYGNIKTIVDSTGNDISNNASNIMIINPFRYRSYYYDSDTNLYYVSSRYYSPEICRFISPDIGISEPENINGYNLYEYAQSNPVNYDDSDGYLPKWAKTLLVGCAVIATIAVVAVATAASGGTAAVIAASALKGALIGAAVGGTAIGTINVVKNRIETKSWKGSGQKFLDGFAIGFTGGAVVGAVLGAVNAGCAINCWNKGSFPTKGNALNYHYQKHVVDAGHQAQIKNIFQYTNDARKFYAKHKAEVVFHAASKAHLQDCFKVPGIAHNAMNGLFDAAGKIITFWYTK